MSLDRPRIEVDFNDLVAADLVLIAADDYRVDSGGQRIEMREGLRVYLYCEDVNDDDQPSFLLASGTVERNQATDWSAKGKWRCRIRRVGRSSATLKKAARGEMPGSSADPSPRGEGSGSAFRRY